MRMKLILTFLFVANAIAVAQNYTVVYAFTGLNGGNGPQSGLTADSAGNLYGTTTFGGLNDFGTVFELPITGGKKVLHHFTGGVDGANPMSGVVVDDSGNVYGTTKLGGYPNCGDIGCGLVFKLTADGKETALHIFKGGFDGGFPVGGLIRDSAGNFYGTSSGGGLGYGVIFRIDPSGHESVLYQFAGTPDGYAPVTQLVRDTAGNLYGATEWGGDLCNTAGCGTVFKLDRAGNETVLYRFTGGSDGGTPGSGVLAIDSAGNLFGTTQFGGDLSCQFGVSPGCGVVYKLDSAGQETVLYSFEHGADGAIPNSGVIRDAKGNLYGSAVYGGDFAGRCAEENSGCGVIFKLSPGGQETVLHTFDYTDGGFPMGPLVFHKGYLYGAGDAGGGSGINGGVVFQLQP
jgi:uncharacterized repeat protein (TIGR03803 family)